MDLAIRFFYRNKNYSCNCYMDIAVDPCFIFVMLLDKELIMEFGEDVTIKTDCVTTLAQKDDYAEMIELREAIFKEFKTTPEFMAAKKRRILWNELQARVYKPTPGIKNKWLPAPFLNTEF